MTIHLNGCGLAEQETPRVHADNELKPARAASGSHRSPRPHSQAGRAAQRQAEHRTQEHDASLDRLVEPNPVASRRPDSIVMLARANLLARSANLMLAYCVLYGRA